MSSELTEAIPRSKINCLALIATWLFVVLYTIDAYAQANAVWGPEQLMTQLGQFQQGKAHFVERKYMKVLQSPLELTGTLTYEVRGKLVKQTLQPTPETLTIDDDRLTIERRGKKRTLRLQDYPQLWAFVASIRSTLNGDLVTLRQFYDLKLEGDEQRWELALQPKDTRMRVVIDVIQISGSEGHINTVEVREAKGDRSVMTIVEDPL